MTQWVMDLAVSVPAVTLAVGVSLKAVAIVLMAAVAAVAMGRHSAARRSLAWTLGLVALVLLPVLAVLGPEWTVLPPLPGTASDGPAASAVAPAVPASAEDAVPGASTPASDRAFGEAAPLARLSIGSATTLFGDPASQGPQAAAARPEAAVLSFGAAVAGELPGTLGPEESAVPPPSPGGILPGETVRRRAASWPLVLVALWLVGAIVSLVPRVVGSLRLRAIEGRALPPADPTVKRAFATAARDMDLRRRVSVLVSPDGAMPMTWGSLRPRLVLPTTAEQWTHERLRHVFLHELAHVRRWDHATDGVCALACAVHWFNPAVWWAASRARLERERACDDRVLAVGCRPSRYATDLLDVARTLRLEPAMAAASIPMARSSQLGARLASILDSRRGRKGVGPVALSLSSLMLVGLVVPLAALTPRSDPPSPPGEGGVETGDVRLSVGSMPAGSPRTLVAVEPAPEPSVWVDGASASSVEERALFLPGPRIALVGTGDGPARRVPVVALTALAAHDGSEFPVGTLPPAVRPDMPQAAFCPTGSRGRRSTSISDDDEGRLELRWSSDDCNVSIDIEGDIRFSATDDAIESMGRRARLSVAMDVGGIRRELEVEPDPEGRPQYSYEVDGQSRPFDGSARAWLAGLLPQLFRETGYQAEERVRRILAQSGVEGVLAEVAVIDSDYVARVYLGLLIQHGDLSTAQFGDVVALAGDRLESDYELAELLIHVADTEGLSPSIRDTYLQAAEGLDSDYEHRRVLSVLLDQDHLDPTLVDAVIESATRLGSDYERAELLIQAQALRPLSGPGREAYLSAVDAMGSDYEARRVLSGFLDHGALDDEEVARVLSMARSLESDYELAELLIRVGRENELTSVATDAYLDAVRSIDSDYELRRTLLAVLDGTSVDNDNLATVLDLSHAMESDYERAELLVHVARHFRLSPALRDAYRNSADAIDSEHEQNRAYAALARAREAEPRP